MRSRKLTRSLAIGAALALTVAACGGDDDDAADEPAESDNSDAATDDAADDGGDDAATDDGGDDAADDDAADGDDDAAADEGDEPAEASGDQASIRFTWWGNPERDEMTNAMAELFMAQNPDIEVVTEPTVFDGYFDKLAVSFAAGDAPDVITLGGSYPTEYGAAGQLVDVTTLADTIGLDAYDPSTYSTATLDGAVYGLPTGGNARGLLINLDLFEEAGVEVPDEDTWTWQDYIDIAGELSAALPDDVYGTDWRIDEMKEEYVAQRGGETYPTSGGVGADVETITDLFSIPAALLDNGGMPPAEITTELADTTMEQTLFGQGNAAMMFGYSNNVQGYADILGQRINMIKMPGESEFASPGLTVLPSQYFSIFSGTDHPEEAARFIDFMLNDAAAQEIILANRGLSFNPTVLEAISPSLGEFEAQSADYVSQVAAEGRPEALNNPTEGKGEVDDLTTRLQDEVMFGSLSPEDAAQQWIDEASSIIPA